LNKVFEIVLHRNWMPLNR